MLFELLQALAKRAPGKVGLLIAWNAPAPEVTEDERDSITALTAIGVHVLPELAIKPRPLRSRLARLLSPRLEDLHPEAASSEALQRCIEPFGPDVVLPVWSEWLTAALSSLPYAKFAYYGNPDLKSVMARANFFRELGELPLAKYLRIKLMVAQLEPAHLEAMRRYQWLGNVAANDADYYVRHGHPAAFYIQNTWFDRYGPAWLERRERAERGARPLVLANVGKLSGTANTLGLHYLGTQVLPEIAHLRGHSCTLRICGAGTPHAVVQRALHQSGVEMAGFVPDIDEAILESPVFLCVNNATRYKVGHTRYLHAWSLGACVVAHRDAALSMPEIVHGENALLGANAAEIAGLVSEALDNQPLRRRIGQRGYETFRERFSADVVAARILATVG